MTDIKDCETVDLWDWKKINFDWTVVKIDVERNYDRLRKKYERRMKVKKKYKKHYGYIHIHSKWR